MRICYMDEAGDTGCLRVGRPATTPIFLLAGVIIPSDALRTLTLEYLHLKDRHFPGYFGPTDDWLDRIRSTDMDGAKLRRAFRRGERSRMRLHGLVVMDGRDVQSDSGVSFSIFTQKHRARGGDAYPHVVEAPLLARTVTHAGLQIADALASGLLFPTATFAFCSNLGWNLHASPGFGLLRDRYGRRLEALQAVRTPGGKTRNCVGVSDPLARRRASELFR